MHTHRYHSLRCLGCGCNNSSQQASIHIHIHTHIHAYTQVSQLEMSRLRLQQQLTASEHACENLKEEIEVLQQQCVAEQATGTRDLTATDEQWKTRLQHLDAAHRKQLKELRHVICVHPCVRHVYVICAHPCVCYIYASMCQACYVCASMCISVCACTSVYVQQYKSALQNSNSRPGCCA
jgi:hypothetical protein